jgi:hypothetical protein
VHLSAAGVPYLANMLVTAVVCWGVLFATLEVVTPAVEMLGKHVAAMIWRQAYEKPAGKKPTLFPFSKELLLGRPGANPNVSTVEEREVAVNEEKEIDVDGKKVASKIVDKEEMWTLLCFFWYIDMLGV